uniref:Uncharacterized protein n=1 Tax=Amphora coffeiformis TaxID=265554 RepID=A0A7S3L6I9_9STRA
MSGPRVSFHHKTVNVPSPGLRKTSVVPPAEADGDGTIFVSIASYRDGERCGETLKSIFENAKNPDKVIVGLAEQNDPNDAFCLEEYCKKYGFETIKRQPVRKDVTKILTKDDERAKCPHYDQVRQVSFHDIQAKGPAYTRSLTHKVLGNEEFCLQIDAHTQLVPNWDVYMKEEWKAMGNEFGVLSTIPPATTDMDSLGPTGDKATHVPRQCFVKFRDNGVPDFEDITENSEAIDLEKPLLSHGWSAAYSFSKCHLEESVPYDPFSHYAKPVEQFVRYTRMWTRGYDTYTPTRNYLFHDYGTQPNGHGNNEWFGRQRTRFRLMAIRRAKKVLNLLDEQLPESNLANLGLYGLGKRRSLAQLQQFAHIDLKSKQGNEGDDAICVHNDYVPYDRSISPVSNLYDEPANLDAQPEYPLRTDLKFAHQPKHTAELNSLDQAAALGDLDHHHHGPITTPTSKSPLSKLPSTSLLLLLWIFGLVVWCLLFWHNPPPSREIPKKRTPPRKVKPAKKRVFKDV